jgi:hypothetical protein
MTTQAALGINQIHPLVTPATDPKEAPKDQEKRMINRHRLLLSEPKEVYL